MHLPEIEHQDLRTGQELEQLLGITENLLTALQASRWTEVTELTAERGRSLERLASAVRERAGHNSVWQPFHVKALEKIREKSGLMTELLEKRKLALLHAMEATNADVVQRAYEQQERR